VDGESEVAATDIGKIHSKHFKLALEKLTEGELRTEAGRREHA
jgi:hypothetical protein